MNRIIGCLVIVMLLLFSWSLIEDARTARVIRDEVNLRMDRLEFVCKQEGPTNARAD